MASKLTLILLVFASSILAVLGTVAYLQGRSALLDATLSGLLSAAIEKEAALDAWADERLHNVTRLADPSHIGSDITALQDLPPDSALAIEARGHLLSNLAGWSGEAGGFQSLMVLAPETGEIVLSTNAAEVGTFKENRSYFLEGRQRPFIQSPYYSVTGQAPAMVESTPILARDGRLLGVLAGRLKLTEMNNIISRRTGLHDSDDAYLVNASRLLVTQPRLIEDPAVLLRGIQTAEVLRCRTGADSVGLAVDFRGTTVVAVHRWLSGHCLCLVVKIDQAEALEAVHALGRATLISAIVVLLAAGLLAVVLARRITRPVRVMGEAAAAVARGDLTVRLAEHGGDEMGHLAREFNCMTKALAQRTVDLKRSEAQFRSLFQNAQVPMHVLDADYRVLDVSGVWQRTLGHTRDAVIGAPITKFMTPESRANVQAQVMPEFDSRRRLDEVPLSFVTKSGDVVEVLLSAFAELDPRGAVARRMAVLVDVTRRKQAEDGLKQLNEELEQRVETRTAELRAAQEELVRKERLAALGQLAGTVSHELRNPLGAMRTSIVAIKRLAHGANPILKSSVEIVDRSITRCDNIIADLLDYSRVRELEPRRPRWTAGSTSWWPNTHCRRGSSSTWSWRRRARPRSTRTACARPWSTCWTTLARQ